MAKVDLSRDYYGDLDLPPGSSEADIKKAFKKLALKYHPDRNPGREAEVNSKFQTINTAHEILTDAAQKSKYDAGRKPGRGAASSFKTAASGTYARGNPWASAGSEWAPPPKREPARPPKPPPASAGAQRYTTNFTTPNPNTPPRPPQYDAEANKKNWEAWNNMKNPGATKVPPFTPMPPRHVPKEYTSQSGREESNNFRHPPQPKSSKPGYEEFRASPASFGRQPSPPRPSPSFGKRPSPQRPPPQPARKSGFTPHTPGGDEPAAPKTSAYFTRRDSRPSTSAYLDNEAPPVPGGRPEPNFARETRFMDDDSDTPCEPRISTPYASHGGEKLNPFDKVLLSRTKSTRERGPRPFSPNSDRHRSFSPPRTRMHRHVSPDSVPRADSDANLKARGSGSPKRTHSSANRNNTTRGKPPPIYSRVESDSSNSEDEIQPQRPIAKSRLRRTGTSQHSGPDNTKTVRTDNRNGSVSSGAASGPSPAYDNPSQYQRFYKSPLLPTVFEDYSSLTSVVQEMSELSNFKYSKKYTTASSEVTAAEWPNLPSASVDSPHQEDAVHILNGSLNLFERKQFHLLDQLVKNGKPRGFCSHFKPPYDSVFPDMEMSHHVVESQCGDQSYALPTLRQAYEKSHLPSSISYGLGSPNKMSRRTKQISVAKQTHNVTRTDHTDPSFSFKTTVESDRPSYQFTSNSEENINTNFTSEEWGGKFGSGDNYFAPTPGEPLRRGMSRTKSGRRSPTKRDQPNRPVVGPGTSIPSTDPEILGRSVDEDDYSASPGGTKFKPEEWAQTFKAQIFEYPQTVPAGSSTRRGPFTKKSSKNGSKGPSVTRTTGTAAIVNEDSSSDDPIYMKRAATESSGVDSPNAMDIDSPGETRQGGGTQPRNVGVEPSNPAWRDQSNGSRSTPDPPLPPRLPNTNASKPKSKDGDELEVKLEDLKNVEPLRQSSAGLKSFNDLNSQLPWTSRAASFVPLSHSVSTGKINLPHPPKPPAPPAITAETMRPTPSAWKTYADHFKAYMNAWRVFDEAMISHFVARRQQVNEMGDDFQNEFGDVKLDKYERGLGEDKTIMAWWEEASRRHAAAMQEFRGWKSTFREGAVASRLT